MQELYHIHDLVGGDTLVLALQQTGIVDLHKCCTTHGWSHYIVKVLKLVFKLLSQGYCHLLKSRVSHRLTAAGLIQRIFHIQTKTL